MNENPVPQQEVQPDDEHALVHKDRLVENPDVKGYPSLPKTPPPEKGRDTNYFNAMHKAQSMKEIQEIVEATLALPLGIRPHASEIYRAGGIALQQRGYQKEAQEYFRLSNEQE